MTTPWDQSPLPRTFADGAASAIRLGPKRHTVPHPKSDTGPTCGHVVFAFGCQPCLKWAASDTRLGPNREARAALMESIVAAVRDGSISPEHGRAMLDEPITKEPSIVLTGEDMAAFDEFSLAAAALEAHAEQMQALQQRYQVALQAVSRMAARRNRGK